MAGLPMVTKIGKSYSSRMASSLLNSCNMNDLITKTAQDYENLSLELANKPDKLENVRKRLQRNIKLSLICHTELYTRNLEAAYNQAYNIYYSGENPRNIEILEKAPSKEAKSLMIYGLVPIGGKGTRLGLTFSKEMLPQKGTSHFNPISNHLVSKMRSAGAEQIIFIHGFEFKRDVIDYFNSDIHHHYIQRSDGFSNVLKEFLVNIPISKNDLIFLECQTRFLKEIHSAKWLLMKEYLAVCSLPMMRVK